jgi:hypothetical protein
MIRRFALAGGVAAICSVAVMAQTPATGGSAQTPPSRPGAAAPADQDRTADQSRTSAQPASIVLSGCLKREEQVPGRQPNIVERQGVMEDYILTNASRAASGSSGAVGTSGAAGTTSGAPANISTQYKVEGIPDERLSQLVGKRVEVTGRVDADDAREAPAGTSGAAGAARPATPAAGADMPEFEAVSIREVAGSCDEAR